MHWNGKFACCLPDHRVSGKELLYVVPQHPLPCKQVLASKVHHIFFKYPFLHFFFSVTVLKSFRRLPGFLLTKQMSCHMKINPEFVLFIR